MASVLYRIKQFYWVVSARPLSERDRQRIGHILSPAEIDLFNRYSLSDQNHAVRVLTAIQASGHHHPALLKAALLHDIGKTKLRLTVWDRSLNVLASLIVPHGVAKWGQDASLNDRWRTAFIMNEYHAHWGAVMVADIDGDCLLYQLIDLHQAQAPPNDETIAHYWSILKSADEQN